MPKRRASTVPARGRPRPRIICVLGMHRSGTSAATRMLNLLGVYLGPASRLMPAKPDNPTGYWEYRPFSRINDEILARLGGNWQDPPVLAPGWERNPALGHLKRRARTLVRQDFAGRGLWGWKDPRTCLTLPFWQRLQRPMRYVVCLRNPWDAAQSLERRYGSFDKGVSLWLAYTHAALLHTQGQNRLFLYYEDLMSDWIQALRRLAHFVGRPGRAMDPKVLKAVGGFIDGNLHHHRTSVSQLVKETDLPFPAKAVYIALRSHLTQHDHGRTPARFEELESSLGLLCKEALATHEKLEANERALPAMDQRIQGLEGLVATLEATLGERERQVQAAEELAQERLAGLGRLQEALSEHQKRLHDLAPQLQGLEASLIQTRRNVEALEERRVQREQADQQRIRGLEESLSAEQRRLEAFAEEVRERDRAILMREAALQEVDRERQGLLQETQRLREQERELRHLLGLIQQSRGWRLLERYRGARRRLEKLWTRPWGRSRGPGRLKRLATTVREIAVRASRRSM